ncbi:MAG: hypothetical protein Q9169_004491 [Polycauliona sp. 2 TL-2023]
MLPSSLGRSPAMFVRRRHGGLEGEDCLSHGGTGQSEGEIDLAEVDMGVDGGGEEEMDRRLVRLRTILNRRGPCGPSLLHIITRMVGRFPIPSVATSFPLPPPFHKSPRGAVLFSLSPLPRHPAASHDRAR